MSYTNMDIARALIREAEKIFDLISVLKDDNDMIPRVTVSNMAYATWNEMIELRCELEEMAYDRLEVDD